MVGRVLSGGRCPGRQGKEKKTAFAYFALDAYLAPQFLDDVEHDRKAQTVSQIIDAADLVGP